MLIGAVLTFFSALLVAGMLTATERARRRLDKMASAHDKLPEGEAKHVLGRLCEVETFKLAVRSRAFLDEPKLYLFDNSEAVLTRVASGHLTKLKRAAWAPWTMLALLVGVAGLNWVYELINGEFSVRLLVAGVLIVAFQLGFQIYGIRKWYILRDAIVEGLLWKTVHAAAQKENAELEAQKADLQMKIAEQKAKAARLTKMLEEREAE